MKIIVTILVITNLLTIGAALSAYDHYRKEANADVSARINELDKFYYGFCLEARQRGMGEGQNYELLCGNGQS